MQSLFGLVPTPDIEISLEDENKRKLVESKEKSLQPLFFDGESVTGKVRTAHTPTKNVPNFQGSCSIKGWEKV
jgi:hypothetical protein